MLGSIAGFCAARWRWRPVRIPALSGAIMRVTVMDNAMATILVVDDEPNIREVVSLYLRRDGHSVVSASDGEEALRLNREHQPDLVVLDLMLPRVSGIEVCRRIQAERYVPVIMLTAKGEEEDRIIGLGVGADDYVVKPFSPRELAARVAAVLRRANAHTEL